MGSITAVTNFLVYTLLIKIEPGKHLALAIWNCITICTMNDERCTFQALFFYAEPEVLDHCLITANNLKMCFTQCFNGFEGKKDTPHGERIFIDEIATHDSI